MDNIVSLIHDHIKPCHESKYDYAHYGHGYGRFWCFYEEQKKCRSVMKVELELKKCIGSKEIDKIKSTLNFVSWPEED